MLVFALYTCKQGKNSSVHRKAKHIARRSSSGQTMKPELFINKIKFILNMASIDFIKAVVETGYMDNFYDSNQFSSLKSGIDQVTIDFKDEIFGERMELEEREWLLHALAPESAWLFEFSSIREKVHSKASVELLHVNALEAKKLFDRLTL